MDFLRECSVVRYMRDEERGFGEVAWEGEGELVFHEVVGLAGA